LRASCHRLLTMEGSCTVDKSTSMRVIWYHPNRSV
jgi:hypothetical protein